jgi:hypothetical protein
VLRGGHDRPVLCELAEPVLAGIEIRAVVPVLVGILVLPDGRGLVVGGTSSYAFTGDNRASIFNPATEDFVQSQDMADGRWYGTATALGDARIMAFSGLDPNGASTARSRSTA